MTSHGPPTLVTRSAAGQLELTKRSHGLSQRHRTILLLADGKRELDSLLAMAAAAGADRSHFEQLQQLGLLQLDLGALAAPPTAAPAPAAATQSSRPRPLERARKLLLEALKEYAPITGSLLARKIRRADSAADIASLLDEAEGKMARSGTLVQASQAVRRARELLARER